MSKAIDKLWFEFDDGAFRLGSWNLPDPNTDPVGFLRKSEDVGFAICNIIAGGAKKCTFHSGDMPGP